MATTWTLNENSTGKLVYTVEGEEWKNAYDKAFRKISKNVSVDGFRKGKVPAGMLKKMVNVQSVCYQAVEDNANDWLQKALEEAKIEPVARPSLDIGEVNEDKAEVIFEVTVKPEVEIEGYTGLPYQVEKVEVSTEDIDKEISDMQNRYAEEETVEGEAENGDTVTIDFEGFKDGEPFEGGKAEDHKLKLGSGSFIPGFEDQLIGKKAGDEVEVNVTFPEDYFEESLRNAPVVFKVKVKEVVRTVLPQLDDDFAKDTSIPGVETVEDLKNKVKERLESSRKEIAENKGEETLIKAAMDKMKVEIPQVMIDESVDQLVEETKANIGQYGIQLESYLKMMQQTMEGFRESLKEEAESRVKSELLFDTIAAKENLEATADDIENEYHELSERYNMEVEKVKQVISEKYIKEGVLRKHAFDFLKDHAVKEEVEPQKEEKSEEEPAKE